MFQEVRELSDKLQNEKATVSRAVAQNRELKEQLIELQDKIVVLSQVLFHNIFSSQVQFSFYNSSNF